MEAYAVKLHYQRPNGYWVFGHVEIVTVPGGKGEHAKAEAAAREKFAAIGCKVEIVSVSYA